jgi:hypothetical protein
MLEMHIMELNISSIAQISKHAIWQDISILWNWKKNKIKVPGITVQKMEQQTEAHQVLADDQHEC